ncbi:MAG: 4Fe-4S dicluster domain-containing protein [Coriobacteriaceae bacterium]|jgi:ferredoxin-type protein NapG|nr:4Fe-4S dicluster domain-containing protein [Coriobacteriaceae bacterium]
MEEKISGRTVSRRGLLAGTAGAAVIIAAGGAVKALAGEADPLRPPGMTSEEHFIGACIRCNRCRGACPRDIIVNCAFEDGIINVRTPRLSFRTKASQAFRRPEGKTQEDVAQEPYPAILAAGGIGFCDFCMLCAQNCPTGALSAFDPRTQWIGEAVIDPAYCIAFEKMGGCRKCVDYCPFGAVTLNESRYPVVDSSKCNGCGICENICPSSTYRTFKGPGPRGINIHVNKNGRPL